MSADTRTRIVEALSIYGRMTSPEIAQRIGVALWGVQSVLSGMYRTGAVKTVQRDDGQRVWRLSAIGLRAMVSTANIRNAN